MSLETYKKEVTEALKLSWIDKAIMQFNPKAVEHRVKSRLNLAWYRYDAARETRLRNNPAYIRGDIEDSMNSQDRVKVLRRVRELVFNCDIIPSVLRKYSAYVWPKIKLKIETGDELLNDSLESFVYRWFNVADVTGRHDFLQLMQLAVMSEAIDGDCGFILLPHEGLPKVQFVEADQIGDPDAYVIDNKIVNGFILNDFGGIEQVIIYSRDKQGLYQKQGLVNSANFFHLFSPYRFSQYRGVSRFSASYNTILDAKELVEAMRIRTKAAAEVSLIVRNAQGMPSPNDVFETKVIDGKEYRTEESSFGKVHYISHGDDMLELKADFPAQQIQTFRESLYRDVAVSLNLSYAFVRDMASLTGPGVRAVLAQDDRELALIRHNSWQRVILPIIRKVLLWGETNGLLPIDAHKAAIDYISPAKITIDLGRDKTNSMSEVEKGLKSRQTYFEEDGKDWRIEAQRIERERLAFPILDNSSDTVI